MQTEGDEDMKEWQLFKTIDFSNEDEQLEFAGVDFSCGKQALFSQNIPQKWTAVWKVRPGLWACLALLLWAAQYSIPA